MATSAIASTTSTSTKSQYVLGPNIEFGSYAAAAPAAIRGAFIPQGNVDFAFFWLEPLGLDHYGTWKNNETRYIRFLAGAELSPFYGTLKAAVGFAPLPKPFSILEFRLVYENENLLFSDVEQALMPNENPHIRDTWNAGYIFDNLYNNSSFSQIQSFGTELHGRYIAKKFELAFLSSFVLIDINSDYDKKSFDYMRGVPLFSRDYILYNKLSAMYNLTQNFSLEIYVSDLESGKRFSFLREWSNYDKEILSFYNFFAGISWFSNDRKSYASFKPGWFIRKGDSGDFNDSFTDSFLLSIQYRYFWNFAFGK